MPPVEQALGAEQAFAAVIVVVLVGMAGFFGWRQWRSLRAVRRDPGLSPEDRSYHRALAWRRLVSCALMLALAGLVASYYLQQDRAVRELIQQGKLARAAGEHPKPTPEQRRTINLMWGSWLIAGVVLLALVTLAFLDMRAVRRFGIRHLRQLQADHRAAVEDQVNRLRSERNGHH